MESNNKEHRDSLSTPLLVKQLPPDLENAKPLELRLAGTTSFFRTCFNQLNALSGIGILSVPYALSSGGWLSLALLLGIASATFYTGLLIKTCMESDPNITTYPDVGDKAFGKTGRHFVSVVINLEMYMVTTGFFILVGDNMHNLLPNVEVTIYGIAIGGKQTFILLAALVVMPTVWIDDLTTLSYVSATGVLASVVVLASVLWSGMSDDIGFRQKGELFNWSGLPTALSLYTLCYCGHPVFPSLYTSMTNQTDFSKVLFICFFICTILNASMGVLGYMMFGSELQSQITLNLPTNRLISKVVVYTSLVNPIAKHALMLRPIFDAIESQLLSKCGKNSYRLLTRSTLVVSSVVVALTLPFYGSLMSLVGAFFSVTSSILLPCLCYLKISGAYRKFGYVQVVIGFTVLMGFYVLVTGTYTSIMEIIQNF